MTEAHVELLKANIDKLVFIGKAISISSQEQDLIYDLLSTTKESQYEKSDQQEAYLIRFQDIESVELPKGS